MKYNRTNYFQQSGTSEYTQAKNESRHNLTLFTTINSKQITDLNIKCKTIKLQEDNVGEKLYDLWYSSDFLDTTPKAQFMKELIYWISFKTKHNK